MLHRLDVFGVVLVSTDQNVGGRVGHLERFDGSSQSVEGRHRNQIDGFQQTRQFWERDFQEEISLGLSKEDQQDRVHLLKIVVLLQKMSYRTLDAYREIPISDRLTDEVLTEVVARLPQSLQESILVILLTWYENHPDVPVNDFVLNLLNADAKSFPMPFGGEFIVDRRGFRVKLSRLPPELLHRIRVFVTLCCDF